DRQPDIELGHSALKSARAAAGSDHRVFAIEQHTRRGDDLAAVIGAAGVIAALDPWHDAHHALHAEGVVDRAVHGLRQAVEVHHRGTRLEWPASEQDSGPLLSERAIETDRAPGVGGSGDLIYDADLLVSA